ncbi:hypothetical protein VF21_01922 [Pseudogymnoascus sp. 05NY08]|nr:hypothetical protein VF21_01922 [Pseudogymnoascus sp. 05NY08]
MPDQRSAKQQQYLDLRISGSPAELATDIPEPNIEVDVKRSYQNVVLAIASHDYRATSHVAGREESRNPRLKLLAMRGF